MKNSQIQQNQEQENKTGQNLSPEAKKLLEILNELEEFTLNLKKKLMAEFAQNNESEKK